MRIDERERGERRVGTRARSTVKAKKGYTLIEVLVTVVILAILATVVTAVMPKVSMRAKKAALSGTTRSLQSGVDRFYLEANVFPTGVQPTGPIEGRLIDYSAKDSQSASFQYGYIRFRPSFKAVDYGLDPDLGDVYFGVTPTGRVFATQRAPAEDAWLDENTPVWVNGKKAQISLREACFLPGGDGGSEAGAPAGITLAASSYETEPGQPITITGQVVDAQGVGVPDQVVVLQITGSVTGARVGSAISEADGTFEYSLEAAEAEIIEVVATLE